MKKFITLVMIMIFIFSFNVFAEGDIQVVLEQPAIYKVSVGDKLNYELRIKVPSDIYDRYKSFVITVLMDSSLKVESTSFNNIEEVKGSLEIKNTVVKKNTQDLLTLSVNDTNLLKSKTDFSVNINTTVKKDKVGENFKNSFVLTYVDKKGVENSKQKNLISNTNAQEGNISVSNVANTSRFITGKTEPEAKVKAFISGKEVANTTSDGAGNFSLNILPQEEGTEIGVVAYFKKDGEDKSVSKKIVVKNEKDAYQVESMLDDLVEIDKADTTKLSDVIKWAKSMSLINKSEEDLKMLNAAIANAEYIEVKKQSSNNDIKDALERLYESIKVFRKPIMTGYSTTEFGAKKNITRAEAASVFTKIKLNTSPKGVYSSFTDVSQDKWYADYIGYMEKEGLINGYTDKTFKPEKTITRAEFATIVSKLVGESEEGYELHFNDVKEKHWAYNVIRKVTSLGLMNGRSKTEFKPNEPITRAEVAKVVNRLLNRVPDKSYMDKYIKNPFKDVDKNFWAYYEILEISGIN